MNTHKPGDLLGQASQEEWVRRLARLIGGLMISRKDAKAVEVGPNDWRPDRSGGKLLKYSVADFRQHLLGNRCLGAYLLDSESRVRCIVFDVDLVKKKGFCLRIRSIDEIERMNARGLYDGRVDPDFFVGNLEEALHDESHESHLWALTILMEVSRNIADAVRSVLGLGVLSVMTGGGVHVIVPLPELMPAADARIMGDAVMAQVDGLAQSSSFLYVQKSYLEDKPSSVTVEVFPKQSSVRDGGFGNLVRLPLGLHAGSQVRTFFFSGPGAPAWTYEKLDPLGCLESFARRNGRKDLL
jgi:hypothetical protein